MKITIYSNIFKIDNDIFIVEIFQDSQNQKFLYVKTLREKEEKKDFSIQENSLYYTQDMNFSLILENQNKKKLQIKIKKELTIPLQKLIKDNYIVYIKNKQNIKKIISIELT